MAEQWKELVLSETVALIVANAVAQPLGPSFTNASTELSRRRNRLRKLARGDAVASQQINLDLDGLTAMLGEASRAFTRYNEPHNRFVRVFSIYGGFLGVLADGPLWLRNLTPLPAADPMWQSWVQRRAVAFDCINEASQRRRTVAVYDLATVDAFTVAGSFPEHSPDWNAWMRAAADLAASAAAEAREASLSELRMYAAVYWECYDGLQILNT